MVKDENGSTYRIASGKRHGSERLSYSLEVKDGGAWDALSRTFSKAALRKDLKWWAKTLGIGRRTATALRKELSAK